VGYKLSPFLWKKVAKGLSAGRVQSVAVRLIVEREREIQNFKPEEYWTVEALLRQQFPISNFQFPKKSQNSNSKFQTENENKEFIATLIKKGDKPIGKFDIKTKENADKILKDLEGAKYQIAKIEKIPVYVIADSWKYSRKGVPVEQRNLNEVWDKAPKKIKIKNPAFEFVPKKYITKIISEFGTLSYDEFLRKVRKN